jgi:hypothetical protein
MTTLRAEWTKLRSVRSTTWMLLAIVALPIAFGAVSTSTSHAEGLGPGDPKKENVVAISLAGIYFAQIAAIAFGVLAICGEYATGTIRATFAANPRRRRVLAAKAAIVGALVLGAAAVAALVAFYLGQAMVHGNGFDDEHGYPAASLADGATLRTVAIAAVYPVVLALLSLGAARRSCATPRPRSACSSGCCWCRGSSARCCPRASGSRSRRRRRWRGSRLRRTVRRSGRGPGSA